MAEESTRDFLECLEPSPQPQTVGVSLGAGESNENGLIIDKQAQAAVPNIQSLEDFPNFGANDAAAAENNTGKAWHENAKKLIFGLAKETTRACLDKKPPSPQPQPQPKTVGASVGGGGSGENDFVIKNAPPEKAKKDKQAPNIESLVDFPTFGIGGAEAPVNNTPTTSAWGPKN